MYFLHESSLHIDNDSARSENHYFILRFLLDKAFHRSHRAFLKARFGMSARKSELILTGKGQGLPPRGPHLHRSKAALLVLKESISGQDCPCTCIEAKFSP